MGGYRLILVDKQQYGVEKLLLIIEQEPDEKYSNYVYSRQIEEL